MVLHILPALASKLTYFLFLWGLLTQTCPSADASPKQQAYFWWEQTVARKQAWRGAEMESWPQVGSRSSHILKTVHTGSLTIASYIPCLHRVTPEQGLQRWLSCSEPLLLFQRTGFLAPTWSNSQSPVVPAVGNPTPSSGLHGCLRTHVHIHRMRDTYT